MFYLALDIFVLVCALFCLRSWLLWRRRNSFGLRYPPGPKGLPLIGNILDMPGSEEWETARQWGEKYGDLVFIQNFGTPYLFINSYDTAVEFFEKRGHVYSTRPMITMIELEGWSQWFTAMMPYGDELRKARQYLHRFFQRTAMSDYLELQTQTTHKLLLGLLESPIEFSEHIKQYAGETIVTVAYGFQVTSKKDPYIELMEEGMTAVTQAQTFFLVNALPSLRYLPEWFPGTEFHKIAKEGRRLSQAMLHDPFDRAKKQMADGTAKPSMTSKLIEANTDKYGCVTDEALIEKVTGITYGAAAHTTVSSLLTFLLAMVLYPEAMRRGQEELDDVVGKDSLPAFEDRPNLPYINAICNEVLRWQTVTGLGVAHCASEDDVYNGFFIPAGTTVYSNIWAMLRNPKDYPEPEKFIPERWLPSDGKEPPLDANKMAFGFGRRICPGRHFAENAIFIAVASILAVYDIQKALDEDGVPITPTEEYTTFSVRHPKPFKCKIRPRSDKMAILIRETVDSAM